MQVRGLRPRTIYVASQNKLNINKRPCIVFIIVGEEFKDAGIPITYIHRASVDTISVHTIDRALKGSTRLFQWIVWTAEPTTETDAITGVETIIQPPKPILGKFRLSFIDSCEGT